METILCDRFKLTKHVPIKCKTGVDIYYGIIICRHGLTFFRSDCFCPDIVQPVHLMHIFALFLTHLYFSSIVKQCCRLFRSMSFMTVHSISNQPALLALRKKHVCTQEFFERAFYYLHFLNIIVNQEDNNSLRRR